MNTDGQTQSARDGPSAVPSRASNRGLLIQSQIHRGNCPYLAERSFVRLRQTQDDKAVRCGGRPGQFTPRTGAQGSLRTDGINFWSLNHAPGALVPTRKLTRSPTTLIGSSRSFGAGLESDTGCCAAAKPAFAVYAVRLSEPEPSTYMAKYGNSFRCEPIWSACSSSWCRKK